MFVDQLARRMKRERPQISPQLRSLLLTHPFPGNVRQLKHALERAVALSGKGILTPSDLPPEMLTEENKPNLPSQESRKTSKIPLTISNGDTSQGS